MKRIVGNMKKVLSLIVLVQLFYSCKGQTTYNEQAQKFKPDVKIKVDKEYDKDNNITRYDSSYSYSYSGPLKYDLDSLLKNHLFESAPGGFRHDRYNNFFEPDSLLKFFDHGNSFESEFFKNAEYLNKLMLKDLESLRQKQLKDYRPPVKKENSGTEI